MFLILLLLFLQAPSFPADYRRNKLSNAEIAEANRYCNTISSVTQSNTWNVLFNEVTKNTCAVFDELNPKKTLDERTCGSLHCACIGKDVYGICLHKTEEKDVQITSHKKCDFLGILENRTTVSTTANGNLRIHFEGKDHCHVKHPLQLPVKKQYMVTLICDTEKNEIKPEYVGGSDSCKYHFVWRTEMACNIQAVRAKRAGAQAGFCRVRNPLNNSECDLSFLADTLPITWIDDSIGQMFQFSICGRVESKHCKLNSGVCKVSEDGKLGVSWGLFNGRLIWEEESLYLNYTGGDVCEDTDEPRYTVIKLFCGQKIDMNLTEDACYTIIHLTAPQICPESCTFVKENLTLESFLQHPILFKRKPSEKNERTLSTKGIIITVILMGLVGLAICYVIGLFIGRCCATRCRRFRNRNRVCQENAEAIPMTNREMNLWLDRGLDLAANRQAGDETDEEEENEESQEDSF